MRQLQHFPGRRLTNENGRIKTAGVNLEWCLQQQNWDITSLQESTSRIFNNGAAIHLELSRVWFEVVTGQSCIGNAYRPLYSNSPALSPTEEQIQMFQAGAHKAVEQMKTE